MTKDDTEIVLAVRASLASKVGQARFDLWFGAGTRLDYNGRSLRIGAPSQFFLDWIRGNFRQPIEQACREVLGECPAIEFLVDASGGEGNGDAVRPMQIRQHEKHEGASYGRGGLRAMAGVERSAPPAAADRPTLATDRPTLATDRTTLAADRPAGHRQAGRQRRLPARAPLRQLGELSWRAKPTVWPLRRPKWWSAGPAR